MKDDRVLLVLLVALGFASFMILKPFLAYVLFSIVFAIVFYPLYEKVKSTLKFAPLAAILIIVNIILLIIVPTLYLTITIITQTRDITSHLSTIELTNLKVIEERVSAYFDVELNVVESMRAWLLDLTTTIRSAIIGNIINFTRVLANFVAGTALMFFVMYYLFVDGKQIIQQVKKHFPIEDKYKNYLFNHAYQTVHALFLGLFLTAVVQGILAGLGYFFFGIPNVIFWAFVTGVFSLIPFLGPPVIYVPAAISLLLQGNVFGGLGLLLFGFVLISNIDTVVRAQLVRLRVKIHPLSVILGVVGGVAFLGFSGIVMGPLILVLFVEVVKTYQLVRTTPKTEVS